MVFVEFTHPSNYNSEGKLYFVGTSLDAVLADTNGGTRFGSLTLLSHRQISEEDARALQLGFIDEGITAVKMNYARSFSIGPVNYRKIVIPKP